MTVNDFGTHRLFLWTRILVRICQAIPFNSFTKRLLFIFRKPVFWAGKSPIDADVKGARFRLYPYQNLSDKRLLCTPDQLDGIERKFLADRLECESWLVDLGANIGGYSLLLAAARHDLRVVAVEADPELAKRLRENVVFSGLEDRVKIVNVAVSDVAGTLSLNRDPVNRGKNKVSRLQDYNDDQSEIIEVDAIPLLDILDSNQIVRPDVVKMDIEGFEFNVLKGFFSQSPKYRWPKYIQLEQHRKEPFNEAVELTLENGYRLLKRTRMNVLLERV